MISSYWVLGSVVNASDTLFLFFAATALLTAEASGFFPQELEALSVRFQSVAEAILGLWFVVGFVPRVARPVGLGTGR